MPFAQGSKTMTVLSPTVTMYKQRATGLDSTLRTVFDAQMVNSPYWTLWIHNDGSNAFTNCDVFVAPNLSDEAAAALNAEVTNSGPFIRSGDPTPLAAAGTYYLSSMGFMSQVIVQIAADNSDTTDANVWLFVYHPAGVLG